MDYVVMIEARDKLNLAILHLPPGTLIPPSRPGDTYFLTLQEAQRLRDGLTRVIDTVESEYGIRKKRWFRR